MTPNAAVIIPFYKPEQSRYEEISLRQCVKVLGQRYPLIAIKPERLEATKLPAGLNEVISFNDAYFRDVRGYSRMMLSEDFYRTFLGKYDYLLIHQLDAFVFRDELDHWCKKGYDYIGAPWLREKDYPDWVKAAKSVLINRYHIRFNIKLPDSHIPSYIQFENQVGNGGFSLRRVEKFHSICQGHKKLIDHYNEHSAHHHFNEDVFWSIEVNRYRRRVKKPSYRKALRFSIENLPEKAFRLTEGRLPFGCHAWDLHTDFWRPWFAAEGYRI